MKRIFTLSLLAFICSFGAFAQGTITTSHLFGMGCCVGGTCALEDSVTGGTWSSSNTAIATVDASGIVTGVSAGICTISYTVFSTSATATFYVSASPSPISGAGTICVGTSLTLTDATAGGSWSSAGPVASVNSMTGLVNGLYGGMQLIYYVVGTGCYAETTVTVDATAFGSDSMIHGPSTVCLGSTITLSNSVTGGTWSTSSAAIATVGMATGVVTGIGLGTATISYTISGSCGLASITKNVTVTNTADPGVIYGSSSVFTGSSITLVDSVSGGTWSSSNPAVATVGVSGIVTGVAAGTATISYAVAGCGSTAYATKVVTVSTFDGISGNVVFSGSPYYGSVKVWLIRYDPTLMTLTAVDSLVNYCGADTMYYQFTGLSTDSFRVKAAISDSLFTPSGYIPTYHSSFYYWHDADVIHHTSGTSDVHKDINMLSGSSTGGPGFISGSVLTGANRGTSLGSPVVGMRMICLTSSGTVVQMVRTDASGNYSFSSLPYDTYTVFPDSLNYFTTPLTGVTLSASSSSFSGAGFLQHNNLKTITPGSLGTNNLTASVATVSTFPNPTAGRLSIVWTGKTAENADITISDVAGREVYRSSIKMTAGPGATSINLSSLNNGLYVVNVRSASVNYTGKVQVAH